MSNKKTIYHFIIDKSGSMTGMERQAVEGFNTQLATLKELKQANPEQQILVSLTYFNEVVNNIITNGNVSDLVKMNQESYQPNGTTALLDAIGNSIYRIKTDHGLDIANDEATAVLIIITDGYENASRLYTYHEIASQIKELDQTGKWTFSFLGADLDAVHTSKMLNIRSENVMSFAKSNFCNMMDDVSTSIKEYESRKVKGNLKNDIFDIFKIKDKRNAK